MANTINASTSPAGIVQAADASGILQLQTGGTTAVTIDASQNVGIGTSAPSYRLEVKGASATAGQLSIHDGTGDTTVSGVTAASLLFQARDTSIRTLAEIDAVNTTTNGTGGAMVFQTRISDVLAERARIDSSGNLLVGTTSADAIFQVKGAGSTSATRAIRAINSSSTELLAILNDGSFYTGGAASSPYNATTATAANVYINSSGQLFRSTSSVTGFKNLLIDAGFTINQRGYVSAATLATTVYAHDRWKAGASGGDYSFTQNASSTTITIASGKSLIQVVEDKNVNGTSFVLSWTGTAQARYAVNSATPAGSYAASPIVITGQTQGTTMSVEFNTGTLTTPQLEKGSVATSFDYRPYGTELALCQRYYETGTAYGEGYQSINAALGIGGKFQVIKRATPTMTYPTFTNITNARVGADRTIFTDSYARYCLANATAQLAATETFTASAEL